MKLTNPDDTELNVIFALEIAGWTWTTAGGMFLVDPKDGLIHNVPDFVKSVDAVLPWMEKCKGASILFDPIFGDPIWRVDCALKEEECDFPEWRTDNAFAHNSLAKAAVVSLLKAHGVEVEFT